MTLLERFEVVENRGRSWTKDLVLTGTIWLFTVLPFSVGGHTKAFFCSCVLVLPLLLRRRYPLIMLAVMTLGGIFLLQLVPFPVPALIVVPIAVFSIARWVPGPPARSCIIIGTLASFAGPAKWYISPQMPNIARLLGFIIVASFCLGLVLTPYVIGRRVRETAIAKQAQADAAMERYQRMVQYQEQRARMEEGRARAEIARELHDIVAHSLSVMVVQAEGGKALARKHPEKTEQVLATIAETGREALNEMRRIVGVLRSDEQPPTAEYSPHPGLADLPEMLAKAGDRVKYHPPVPLPILPPTLGLTVFRIAQESITNFLKHAGPDAKADISIQYTPRHLLIRITDDGLGAKAANDGAGSGLKGMHERIATMGGQLVATTNPEKGFTIIALLPLAAGLSQIQPQ